MGSLATWIPAQLKQHVRRLLDPFRYRMRLRFQRRTNHVYSQFHRFPSQYRALVEQVVPALLKQSGRRADGLSIAVFACCGGEEVYTLSHELRTGFPDLPLRMRGFDIVPALVEQGQAATYDQDQVRAGAFVTDEFIAAVFDDVGGRYSVKEAVRAGTSLEVADMTDSALMTGLGKFDLVFAQNVLFHLPRPIAARTFSYLVDLLGPSGALFVNGMDTDMRVGLTKLHGLDPLDYLVEEIHEEARLDRGATWAYQYWGREPFSRRKPEWLRRYCTIYLKGL